MKNIGIKEPCKENWNEMDATENGGFCHSCSKEVHDFTNKSNSHIKNILRSANGAEVCGRMTSSQELSLNSEFSSWKTHSKRSLQTAFLFSMIVVFGLSLFSCSNEKEKELIKEVQTQVSGKMANAKVVKGTLFVNDVQTDLVAIQNVEASHHNAEMGRISYEVQNKVSPDIQYVEHKAYTIKHESADIHLMGAMVYTREYDEYLVPLEKIASPLRTVELDVNGLAFPEEFDTKLYPNPISTRATLEIATPTDNRYVIDLFDLGGKHIKSIHDGNLEKGTHSLDLDVTNEISGTYIITIRSDVHNKSVKLIKI